MVPQRIYSADWRAHNVCAAHHSSACTQAQRTTWHPRHVQMMGSSQAVRWVCLPRPAPPRSPLLQVAGVAKHVVDLLWQQLALERALQHR